MQMKPCPEDQKNERKEHQSVRKPINVYIRFDPSGPKYRRKMYVHIHESKNRNEHEALLLGLFGQILLMLRDEFFPKYRVSVVDSNLSPSCPLNPSTEAERANE